MHIRKISDNQYIRFNINRDLSGTGIDKNNLAASGIIEIPDPARPDDRLYFVSEINEAATPAGPWISAQPKGLAQCRDMVWQNIKAKRDELTLNGGCLVAGKWYHTDEYSKLQQLALKVKGIANPVPWKTMDGSFAMLDQAAIEAITTAQVARDTEIFTVAETHKGALAALSDVEAIRNYDYSTGWPDRYVPA